MKLGNLKIGVRLGTSFGLMILLTAVVSIIAIQNMKSLSNLTTKLYKHPYSVSTAMLRIDNNIIKIHRAMKDVALAKNDKAIDAALATITGFEAAVMKDFEIVGERFLGDKSQVEEAKKLFIDWRPIRQEVVDLMKAGDKEKAAAITKGKGAKHVGAINKSVGDFIVFAQGKADGFVKNAATARNQALLFTYILLGVAVVLAILLAYFMTRSITIPMKDAVRVAERLANNDLTVKVNASRKDETGQLLAAMKKMVEHLSSTISANAAAADQVSAAASEQASSLEETSSSLEEMSATIL